MTMLLLDLIENVHEAFPLSTRASLFVICVILLRYFLVEIVFKKVSNSNTKYLEPSTIKGYPLLGVLPFILKFSWDVNLPIVVYILQAVHGMLKHVDPDKVGIFEVSYLNQRLVGLSKAKSVEVLLTSNHYIEKSDFYDFLKPWLGKGLLTSKGNQWKKNRKLLTSAFHFKILDTFQPMIYDKSKILVDIIKRKGSEMIPLEGVISMFTVDVICSTAMGVDLDCQNQVSNPYIQAFKRVGILIVQRFVNPLIWPEFLFKLSRTGREFYSCLDIINTNVNKLIKEKKEQFKDDDIVKNSDIETRKGKLAFLDMLVIQHLSDPDSISEEGMRDEINTFMFGGQDTTAAGLVWCIFLLGNYPEEQNILYEEVISVLGEDRDKNITIEDLKNMPYLEMILKESQRLYPSVPFIGRQINDDLIINGYLVKKNCTCVVFPPVLHRDPEFFPDPEKFIPTRWNAENSKGRNPFCYVPFSAGPRNCIGQRFAIIEEKTALANLIRNFKIVSKDKQDRIPVCPELVSRPGREIFVKFIPRVV